MRCITTEILVISIFYVVILQVAMVTLLRPYWLKTSPPPSPSPITTSILPNAKESVQSNKTSNQNLVCCHNFYCLIKMSILFQLANQI